MKAKMFQNRDLEISAHAFAVKPKLATGFSERFPGSPIERHELMDVDELIH